ncbi:MAG: SDR family NAD(P)-dependent oxidoreductase [Nocardioides sp.]
MSLAPGSRVVVTGAARGIGRALAVRLVEGGCQVVINDRDGAELAEVAHEIGAHAVPANVATEAGIEALVEVARDELGGIDAWFGNAGIDRGRGLEMSEQDWSDTHELNVMAHVRAARLLVPEWIERGSGRFVVTASAAGLLTMIGAPAYSVSKHGALAFAEWLSITYRHRGIVVQAICPQGVRTDMLARSGDLEALLSRDSAIEPEAVAELTWEALGDDRFLVLPHPEVGGYYAARATNTDAWLGGMNRLQQKIEGAQR